jgi:tRNA G10  N-methylase Trm11
MSDSIWDILAPPPSTQPTTKKKDLDVPRIVDDELKKLGYNENARLAILGNLGRENSWDANTIFGGHPDPKNKAYNRGLISWQGDRRTDLENFIAQNKGDWTANENNLRLQTRFLDNEIRTKYPKVFQQLNTGNLPTVSRALREYIQYVPTAPYNTPDAEFDVQNNRIWAEKAKQRGLAQKAWSIFDNPNLTATTNSAPPEQPFNYWDNYTNNAQSNTSPFPDDLSRVGVLTPASQQSQSTNLTNEPPPLSTNNESLKALDELIVETQKQLEKAISKERRKILQDRIKSYQARRLALTAQNNQSQSQPTTAQPPTQNNPFDKEIKTTDGKRLTLIDERTEGNERRYVDDEGVSYTVSADGKIRLSRPKLAFEGGYREADNQGLLKPNQRRVTGPDGRNYIATQAGDKWGLQLEDNSIHATRDENNTTRSRVVENPTPTFTPEEERDLNPEKFRKLSKLRQDALLKKASEINSRGKSSEFQGTIETGIQSNQQSDQPAQTTEQVQGAGKLGGKVPVSSTPAATIVATDMSGEMRDIKTDDDLNKTTAFTAQVDLTKKPKGMRLDEYLFRSAAVAGKEQYGYLDEDIERVVEYFRNKSGRLTAKDFGELGTDDVEYNRVRGNQQFTSMNINRETVNRLLNQDSSDNVTDTIRSEFSEQKADLWLKQTQDSFNPTNRAERDLTRPKNLYTPTVYLNETEAENATRQSIEDGIKNPSIWDKAKKEVGTIIAKGANPLKSIVEGFQNFTTIYEKPSQGIADDVAVQQKLDEIKREFGSFQNYQQVKDYASKMPVEEWAIRGFGNYLRSTINTAISSNLKGLDVLDSVAEKVNPLQWIIPEKYRPNLRNLSNVVGFTLASLMGKGNEFERATADTEVDKRLFFNLGKRLEEYLGTDVYIKSDNPLGVEKMTSGLGSMTGFILTGLLAPELAIPTKLGQFGVVPAVMGGIGESGSMYEEAKKKGYAENTALGAGVFGFFTGASEGFGVGGALARGLKETEKKALFKLFTEFVQTAKVKPILKFASAYGKEGLEELSQETFQTTAGDSFWKFLAEKDKGLATAIYSAIKDLPDSIAKNIIDNGLSAFFIGVGAKTGIDVATKFGDVIVADDQTGTTNTTLRIVDLEGNETIISQADLIEETPIVEIKEKAKKAKNEQISQPPASLDESEVLPTDKTTEIQEQALNPVIEENTQVKHEEEKQESGSIPPVRPRLVARGLEIEERPKKANIVETPTPVSEENLLNQTETQNQVIQPSISAKNAQSNFTGYASEINKNPDKIALTNYPLTPKFLKNNSENDAPLYNAFNVGNNEFYISPTAAKVSSQSELRNFAEFYDFQNKQSYGNLVIIKPAKVKWLENRQGYQLIEKGLLDIVDASLTKKDIQTIPTSAESAQGESVAKATANQLTRNYRAGTNDATIIFNSELQRDLFDYYANEVKRTRGGGQRAFQSRVKDLSDLRKLLATQLKVTENDVFNIAKQVSEDVKTQMKGVKHLETRKVEDNITNKSAQVEVVKESLTTEPQDISKLQSPEEQNFQQQISLERLKNNGQSVSEYLNQSSLFEGNFEELTEPQKQLLQKLENEEAKDVVASIKEFVKTSKPSVSEIFDQEFEKLFEEKQTKPDDELNSALQGLADIFEDEGFQPLKSVAQDFNDETYQRTKIQLEKAYDYFKKDVKDVREAMSKLLQTMNQSGFKPNTLRKMKPYIVRFIEEQDVTNKTLESPQSFDMAKISQSFADAFTSGRSFKTIIEARKFASDILGQKVGIGTALAKQVDEAIEVGVVLRTRQITATNKSPKDKYKELLALYEQQPNLAVRTSTSVRQQAYSTPAPLAFIASQLAGIKNNMTVLEPTAGNGMLLIEADNNTNTIANELNPNRQENLKIVLPNAFIANPTDATIGFGFDATEKVDVIIANPPFGTVKENGEVKSWQINNVYKTSDIDHAIVFKSLEAMKDNGRAVFIVGSVMPKTKSGRSDAYNGTSKKKFYYSLYNEYNVVDHFTVSGDLYSKQGASFPVDVIVIDGKGKSARKLPAADVPKVYTSWSELNEKLNEQNQKATSNRRTDSMDAESVTRSRRGSLTADQIPNNASISDVSGGQAESADKSKRGQSERTPITQREFERDIDSTDNARNISNGGIEQSEITRTSGSTRSSDVSNQSKQNKQESRNRLSGDNLRELGNSPERTKINSENLSDTGQISYTPHSKAKAMETLTPTNLYTPIANSLEALSNEVGSIDAYVADRLGYEKDEITNYFGAEQIDALALALRNMERGAGFVIGDQTGIGKGRVVAGVLKYALLKNKTPIFVTEKPNLYKDIMRDLQDIGVQDIRPLLTNGGERIPLDDDNTVFLRTAAPSVHNGLLESMKNDGELSDDYNMLFTTYSQMQTVHGGETVRRELIRELASNAIIVFDESHNAGGQGDVKQKKKGEPPDRADFARELVEKASGVFYSSATYAKRPEVMSLYAKTDMIMSVEDSKELASAINNGGVPLQQAVASMLAESGQYIRRERDFRGINYDTVSVEVNRKLAENVSAVMLAVKEFDDLKQDFVKNYNAKLKEKGENVLKDTSIGKAGINSTNFTAIMHNLIDQMLLVLKTEGAVNQALKALKNNEKVVLTVSNTMGSFIQEFAQENLLQPNDAIALNFGDMLRRYLERSRDITTGDAFGQKTTRRLNDNELGDDGVAKYKKALKLIQSVDWSQVPVSPIDYMRFRLEQEGYSTGEITGRQHTINYLPDGTATYRMRPASEIKTAGRNQTISRFNNGSIDVVVLNQAGSTGLSLHAFDRFNDQRKRRMIVVQAEKNIDTHMQMLGRVNRTGQTSKPAYEQLVADVPAEKRPASVLALKMAKLNANTTASRDSAVTAKGVLDFMNEYGDEVVATLMEENHDIHKRLGLPLKTSEKANEGLERDGAVRKVTGRIPLLPLTKQEEIYELLESEYVDYVEQLTQLGENRLEAQTLPLDAVTLSKTTISQDKGNRPFQRGAYAEEVEVKRLQKPYSSSQVLKILNDSLGLENASLSQLKEVGYIQSRTEWEKLDEEIKSYIEKELDELSDADKIRANRTRLEGLQRRLKSASSLAFIGSLVEVKTDAGNHYGVVSSFRRKTVNKNPLALSNYEVVVLTTDSSRQLKIPISKFFTAFNKPKELSRVYEVSATNYAMTYSGESIPMLDSFDKGGLITTEKRTIITGNLLAGFGQFNEGRIINFTTKEGGIKQGILMPYKWNAEKAMKDKPVAFRTPEQVLEFLDSSNSRLVNDDDGGLKITRNFKGFRFAVPSSKQRGSWLFLNEDILSITGDFIKSNQEMAVVVNYNQAREVIQELFNQKVKLLTNSYKDEARQITGEELPKPTTSTQQPPDILKSVASIDDWNSAEFDQELNSINLDYSDKGQILAPNGKVSNIQNERLAKIIRTQNFKDWFRDSQVVDENGEPRVMYHGSRIAGLTEFKKEFVGTGLVSANKSGGFYFTSNRGTADYYTEPQIIDNVGEEIDEDDFIIYGDTAPYFALHPELDINFGGFQSEQEAKMAIKEVVNKNNQGDAIIWETTVDDLIYSVFLQVNNPAVAEDLRAFRNIEPLASKNGYDGVIVKDIVDGSDLSDVVLVFEPTQIKSIFNRGSFDQNEPSILKSVYDEQNLIVAHNLSEKGLLFTDRLGGLAMPSLAITAKDINFDGYGEITLIGDKELAKPSAKNPVTDADMYSPRYPDATYKVDSKHGRQYFERVLNSFKKYFPADSLKNANSYYSFESNVERNDTTYLQNDEKVMVRFLDENGYEVPKDFKEIKPLTRSVYRQEFDAYVSDVLLNIADLKMRDGSTNLGRPRYKDYTLENVIKKMKSQMKEGESFNYGAGTLRAKTAKKFKNLKDIQSSRNRILERESLTQKKQEMEERLSELASEYKPFYKYSRFSQETFTEAIAEGLQRRNLQKVMEEWGFDVGGKDLSPIVQYVNELVSLPTEYFEAKPQRAVSLREFKIAVVPNTISPEARRVLEKNRLQIFEYNENIANDRKRAVLEATQSRPELLFSVVRESEQLSLQQLSDVRYEKKIGKLLETASIERFGDKLYVSPASNEIYRRAIEEVNFKKGVLEYEKSEPEDMMKAAFLKLENGEEIANAIRAKAKEARSKNWEDSEIDFLNRHADELENAFKENGTAIIYTVPSALPHEFFHQADFLGAVDKSLLNRHSETAKKVLDDHIVTKKLWTQHFSKFEEYRRIKGVSAKQAIIRAEIPPFLLELSDAEITNLGLTPEQVDDYLLTWFEGYAEKGNNLDYFDKENETIQKYIEQIKRPEPEQVGELRPRNEKRSDEEKPQSPTRGSPQTSRISEKDRVTPEDRKKLKEAYQKTIEEENSELEELSADSKEFFLGENQKLASLPKTLRRNGFEIEDIVYDVFGDKVATEEAKKLIEQFGFDGTIDYLKTVNQLDVHHAIASFMIQRALLDRAAELADTNPAEAAAIRQKAQDIARDHAFKAIAAGRFTRAASIISQSVEGIMFSITQMIENKFPNKTLSPQKLGELEATARKLETALTKITNLQRDKTNLRRKIKRLENAEDIERPKKAKQNRVSLADILRDKYLQSIEKAKARLMDRLNVPLKSVFVSPVSEIGEPFYSAVERAIENAKQEKFSADQVKALLNPAKTQGIKQEEVDWLGIDEFLSDKTKVTKQELLDFVRENQVEIEEVEKSDKALQEVKDESDNEITYSYYADGEDVGQIIENKDADLDYQEFIQKYYADDTDGDYYNDWLEATEKDKYIATNAKYDEEGFQSFSDAKDWLNRQVEGNPKFSQYQLEGEKSNYKELLLTMPNAYNIYTKSLYAKYGDDWVYRLTKEEEAKKDKLFDETPSVYNSSHFDEPNILAHIRFNERTDADGKNVLFVEEIQSDAHQEGRRKGYKGQLTSDEANRLRLLNEQVYKIGFTEKERMEYDALNKKNNIDGVPNLPFKKSWHELGFKKALRYAVENGFDQIAWTTGTQQNERYDLSKQIDSFTYEKNADGTYNLEAKKNGQVIQDGQMQNVKENNLEDIIGKDLANKIVNSGKDSDTLTGEGLKIEGQGMKGFYDQILPKFANKYVKKWSSKVADVQIENHIVHSVKITPEMVASVLQGQPLFSLVKDLDSHGFSDQDLNDFAEVGAFFLSEGLRQDNYRPEDFHADMTAEFGDLIGNAFQEVYLRSIKKRDEWLKDLREEKNADRIRTKYGESLEDWEVADILGQEKEKAKNRRAIEKTHRIASGLEAEKELEKTNEKINKYKSQYVKKIPDYDNLVRSISEVAENEGEAIVAVSLLEKQSPETTYNRLEDAGITKEKEKRGLYRKADDILRRAKKRRQSERDALANQILEAKNEMQTLNDLRYQYQREARKARQEIANEFERIQKGEIRYLAKNVMDAFNASRSLMASLDLSAVGRQGGFTSLADYTFGGALDIVFGSGKGHDDLRSYLVSPKATGAKIQTEAVRNMAKSIKQVGFDRTMDAIQNNPNYTLALRAGLDFAEAGAFEQDDLLRGEERFRGSEFIEKIPILGDKILKPFVLDPSERTYNGFLDSQRILYFSAFAEELKDAGLDFDNHPAEFKAVADFVNVSTGRGTMPSNKLAQTLLTLPLFAPRYTLSRLQLLNKTLNPVAYANMPPNARKIVMRSAIRFYGSTMLLLGLAKLLGAVVNFDADDDDFLKISVSNQKIDIFAGTLQPAKAIIKMLYSAIRTKAGFDNRLPAEFYADSSEIIGRYLRGKLSPPASLLVDVTSGADYSGINFWKDYGLGDKGNTVASLGAGVAKRLVPLTMSDAISAYNLDGTSGAIRLVIPNFFGFGSQTYEPRPERPETEAEKFAAKASMWQLPKRGRDEKEKAQIDLTAKLKARSRKGEDVFNEANNAFDSGQINEKQLKSILDARYKTLLEDKADGLSVSEDNPTFLRVWELATPEERKRLQSQFDEKTRNVLLERDISPTFKERLKRAGASVFSVPEPSARVRDVLRKLDIPLPKPGDAYKLLPTDDEQTKLSTAEFDDHQQRVISAMFRAVEKAVSNAEFSKLPPTGQKTLIQSAMKTAGNDEVEITKIKLRKK